MEISSNNEPNHTFSSVENNKSDPQRGVQSPTQTVVRANYCEENKHLILTLKISNLFVYNTFIVNWKT